LKRIISGGQTGVDRAALDAATAAGIQTAGWAPKGFLAEDGPIPPHYGLAETPSAEPGQRTEWNVRDSDATLILATPPLAGGTAWTETCARRHGTPCLVLDFRAAPPEDLARDIARRLSGLNGEVLNAAGPRASEDGAAYGLAFAVMEALIRELRG